MTNPIRPTDSTARTHAQNLLRDVRHCALGVIDPDTDAPMVSRIAIAWVDAAPHILVSDLSLHTKALKENAACSILIGEPEHKGDPLTHPRLTLQCMAQTADKSLLREQWLERHPKAKLYIDFTDFNVMRLDVQKAYLNGGFGKAFHLTPDDLT